MYDAIIIGAGPSGLYTARKLSEAGLRVFIIEKKRATGSYSICTGIVGTNAFREFGLNEGSILNVIQKVKIIPPRGKCIHYEHHEPIAYVVSREILNKSLAVEACYRGVEMQFNSQATNIRIEQDHVEVNALIGNKELQNYHGQMLIIATGVSCELNDKAGLDYPKHFMNAAQAEMEISKVDSTMVFVGNNIAPGAFAWVVPLDVCRVGNTINEKRKRMCMVKCRVGLMTEKNARTCFNQLIEKLHELGFEEDKNYTVQFKPIAQGLVTPTYAERVISIGEAAGQVKTTTGGGIYFGLVGADIAAKVILKAFEKKDFSAGTLAEYEHLWRNALQKEINTGYSARKIFGHLSDNQLEKVFQIIETDGVLPLIQRKGNFDWHRELLSTLFKKTDLFKFLGKFIK